MGSEMCIRDSPKMLAAILTFSVIGGIGGGVLGAIVIGIITLLSGGNIGDVARNVMGSQTGQPAATAYQETAEDRQLADFVSVVLAGTEDVWTKVFR